MAPLLPPADRFFELLDASLREETCVRVILAKPRQAKAARRVTARPVLLRGVPHLSLVHSHPTRDLTSNLPLPEARAALQALVGTDFAHAHLLTTTEDIQLGVTQRGRWSLHRTRAVRDEAEVPRTHDQAKQRLLTLDAPFLQALGVTDAPGRLVPAMARKWKQINKFVEIVDHAVRATGLAGGGAISGASIGPVSEKGKQATQGTQGRTQDAQCGPVRVLDFGAGKGYLTFAVHHHLRQTLGLPAEVTGVELRGDLVALCNSAVERLGLQGLSFAQGDVGHFETGAIDVMIALHACDTATDHALHKGVRAGAAVIMAAPCCHKQIRPQMACPHGLRAVLRHGIHLGQQAEMLTDSLRALMLEAEGYETQVFEFVALEHTSKNKMILATRLPLDAAALQRRRAERQAQAAELKAFYGIREQALETLLAAG